MTSILKADTIQDTDGNNIINENSNAVTIGKAADTVSIPGNATLGASGKTITIPSGATITNSGTATNFGELNTPAFFAGQTSGQSISNTSFTKLNFDTEDFDTDSAFASNQFTVPSGKAGRYFLHAVATGDGSDDFDRQHLAIYVDGSQPTVAGSTGRYSNLNVPSSGGYNTVSTSLILNLSAGAVVSVYFYQDSGGTMTTYEPRTYFMGYRIIST